MIYRFIRLFLHYSLISHQFSDPIIILFKKYKIEDFEVLYSTPTLPNVFPLNHIAESQYPLCNREHTSDNIYIIQNKKTYYYYCYQAD